jgi:hypothetical protein
VACDRKHLWDSFLAADLAVERKRHALHAPAEARQQQDGEEEPVLHTHDVALRRGERLRHRTEQKQRRVSNASVSETSARWVRNECMTPRARTDSMSALQASSGSVSMSGSTGLLP